MRAVRFFQWMFLVLLLGTAIALFGLNFPTFHRDQAVVVSSVQGHEVYGRLYQGSKNVGVLIVGDLDEDQAALQSIAQEFYGSGAHVMTLDYSGHGVSRSDVDLDWLEAEGLTEEIRKGLEVFRRKTGLEDSQILVVGHGWGARGLLHLLTVDQCSFMGASLVAPDIALDGGKSVSPYFKKRDDRSVGWISALNSRSVSIPLQLVATQEDERVHSDSVTALYQKLTGTSSVPSADPETGLASLSSGNIYLTVVAEHTVLPENTGEESALLRIVEKLMHQVEEFDRGAGQDHSCQLLSNTVTTVIKDWARSKAKLRSISSTTLFPMLRIICWYLTALGLLGLGVCSLLLAWNRYLAAGDNCGISLRPWNALGVSLGMWLPAAVGTLVIWLILTLLPIGDLKGIVLPVSMLGSYGLITAILYAVQKMPGAKGELRLIGDGMSFWRTMTSVLMMTGLGCYMVFVNYSGLALGWMAGHQFIWTVFLTAVLAAGFYGIELECDILTDNGGNFAVCMLFRLIAFLPACLCCLLFQKAIPARTAVALLAAFLFSGAFRRHSGGRFIPSVGTAFLFCLMTVPAALIAA